MSVHVISWVLKSSEATLADRLVLIVLADHASGDGTDAYPSVQTIAREARLSDRQVKRALTNLRLAGRIVQTGISAWKTKVYTVIMDVEVEGDNLSPPSDRMSPKPSYRESTATYVASDSLTARDGLKGGSGAKLSPWAIGPDE